MISWVYQTELVKECISQPSKVSLFDDHHLEVLALKSPITIDKAGLKSLVYFNTWKQIDIRIEWIKVKVRW